MKKVCSIIIAVLMISNMIIAVNAYEMSESIIATAQPIQVEVKATSCVLMDVQTGTVLTGLNENEKVYPASITKVMTLLLVCEALENGKLTLDMEITCSQSAAEKGGSQIWLEAGEIMTVDELLKATVVASANDACCLLAETLAGSEEAFCVLMNEKAKQLGMNNTHFDNCSGLDDDTTEHKTTAYDIALMSRELLKYDIIRKYTTIWMDTLRNGTTQLVNTNKLLRTYSGITGLKTGTTGKAGCCVSASAKRDGMELIAVVLGADNSNDRFTGAKNLLDWGFANFEIYSPDAKGCYPENIKTIHGVKPFVSVYHENPNSVIIKKGSAGSVNFEIEIPQYLDSPIAKNTEIGKVIFKSDNEVIGESILRVYDGCEKMTLKNAVISLLSAFAENL